VTVGRVDVEAIPAELRFALRYAEKGFATFPCWWAIGALCACPRVDCDRKGKHPIGRVVPHGLKDATTDPVLIRAWGRQYPLANIAIRTGLESGLVVVDRDDYKGGLVSWEALEAKHGRLPYSLRVRTGSGSLHLYLRHPGGRRISSNTSGKLGPGIDLKADGGYVIAPPSLHVSGRRYEWLDADSSHLEDVPAWLLALLTRYDERPVAEEGPPVVELPEEWAERVQRNFLEEAFERIRNGAARHDVGVWLFQQLRDNRVPRALAEAAAAALAKFANARGELRIVSDEELDRALSWAYSQRPRDPHHKVQRVFASLGLDWSATG